MRDIGTIAHAIRFSAAISACAKGKLWDQASALLLQMGDIGMIAGMISYSAAMSACEKGEQWEQAPVSLRQMRDTRMIVDVISYNAVIDACAKDEHGNCRCFWMVIDACIVRWTHTAIEVFTKVGILEPSRFACVS